MFFTKRLHLESNSIRCLIVGYRIFQMKHEAFAEVYVASHKKKIVIIKINKMLYFSVIVLWMFTTLFFITLGFMQF